MDALVDGDEFHLFVPHRWKRALHLTLKAGDKPVMEAGIGGVPADVNGGWSDPYLFKEDGRTFVTFKSCNGLICEAQNKTLTDRTRGLTRGLYGTNAYVDNHGRRILFGWISGFKTGRGWNGCMSLPRILTLDESGRITQAPAPELKKLRGEHEDPTLFDGPPDVYGCKAALARLRYDDRDILLFCSPGRKDMRHDFTIWVSFDSGKTWPYKKLVKSGPGDYPWMAVGRPGTPSENMVYVLAGKDWCARFNLAWLLSDSEERLAVEK